MMEAEQLSPDEVELKSGERTNSFHPGEILQKEFLEPSGLTQRELAEKIGVYHPRINQIINGKRGISADTAARLARVFDTTEEFWLNLQSSYELSRLREKDEWDEIESIRPAV